MSKEEEEFLEAVRSRDLPKVKNLIAAGANLNARFDKNTKNALSVVLGNGPWKMAKYLLKKNIEVDDIYVGNDSLINWTTKNFLTLGDSELQLLLINSLKNARNEEVAAIAGDLEPTVQILSFLARAFKLSLIKIFKNSRDKKVDVKAGDLEVKQTFMSAIDKDGKSQLDDAPLKVGEAGEVREVVVPLEDHELVGEESAPSAELSS